MEKYQITAFIKIEGRLMTPATSICVKKSSDKDIKEVSIEGMYRVIEKTYSDKFDVTQFKETFISSALQIEHEAAVTFCHDDIEFILIRTMPGVNPERLIHTHNLTSPSVQGAVLVELVNNISKLDNFTHVKDGLYLVRTQAGFKQSLKHYCGMNSAELESLLGYRLNHPTTYPALISVARSYRGVSEFDISWVHINQLKEMLEGY